MTSRRDLLKYFSVGTLIAPAVGAAPVARLIELPKVEIVEAAKIPEPIDLNQVHHAHILLEMMDGTSRRISVNRLWEQFGTLHPLDQLDVSIKIHRSNTQSPVTRFVTGKLSGDAALV